MGKIPPFPDLTKKEARQAQKLTPTDFLFFLIQVTYQKNQNLTSNTDFEIKIKVETKIEEILQMPQDVAAVD